MVHLPHYIGSLLSVHMAQEFESAKAQGNAAFAREEFRDAIRLYTKVLATVSTTPCALREGVCRRLSKTLVLFLASRARTVVVGPHRVLHFVSSCCDIRSALAVLSCRGSWRQPLCSWVVENLRCLASCAVGTLHRVLWVLYFTMYMYDHASAVVQLVCVRALLE